MPLALLALGGEARAQISAPVVNRDSPFNNAVGVGVSIGTPYERDAYFWGLSMDYVRRLHSRWSVAAAITFDQEHEEGSSPAANTFTFVATINWSTSRLLTFTTGIGKGFLDDDNEEGTLHFTDGDWGTGLALGISLPDLPSTVRDAVGLSVAWEWNITKSEPVVSTDLGFSWSF